MQKYQEGLWTWNGSFRGTCLRYRHTRTRRMIRTFLGIVFLQIYFTDTLNCLIQVTRWRILTTTSTRGGGRDLPVCPPSSMIEAADFATRLKVGICPAICIPFYVSYYSEFWKFLYCTMNGRERSFSRYRVKEPNTLDAVLRKTTGKRGPYDLFTGRWTEGKLIEINNSLAIA